MEYPETFLRGLITKNSVTEERYVTAEAFLFQDFRAQRDDNYNELSINWEDSNEAVDVLLNQKKEGTEEPQFKVGFVRMPLTSVRSLLKAHLKDKTFAYESRPVDGNPFHGNLLADAKLSKQITKNLQHSLATLATGSEVYLRTDAEVPYLKHNKKMFKVSVIIPVYGVEKYIERCARSLFEQTLDDIEYIFIDDCTPDKSIEILKLVLEEYPHRKDQVIIHRMEKNSGQAAVRVWGIQNASGEYVIHCDPDDWVDLQLYKELYNKAIIEHADIAICDFCHVFEGGHQKIERGLKKTDNYLSDMMYSKISWSLCNKIIRKELYEKDIVYPAENVGEDMALVLQMSRYVSKVAYVRDLFYYYYCNTASVMNTHTADKTKERYRQMCCNVDIVESAYNNDSKLGTTDFVRGLPTQNC